MSKAKAMNIEEIIISGGPKVFELLPEVAALEPTQDSSIHVTQSTLSHAAPPPVTRPANAGSDSATSNIITASNLFIDHSPKSNSIAVGDLNAFYQKSTLLKLAEVAYSKRDLLALEHIAAQLLSLPNEQAKSAGLYYAAIVAKRSGQERRAISLLESIGSDSFIRAKAIQTLGAIEFDAGRHEAALPLFLQAAREARGVDIATSLNALYQVSAIKSIAGDHRQALDDLLSLWPVVRSVVKTHPHLYANWHNDCAFELLRLGRVEDAKASLSVALASPVAGNYQEYRETQSEIERYERKKIIVAVRSLPKSVRVFRFCYINKRRVLTNQRLRLPVIGRTILGRVTACIRTHAPPLKMK